jgi:[protein-PII] uridylyltransferase
MPRSYRYAFSDEDVKTHALVVSKRHGAPAKVGRFKSKRELGAASIVIIADDRPGLLAMMSAALVMHALDVVHAEAYTRRTTAGLAEAVDVFWVRDLEAADPTQIPEAKLLELEGTLGQLIEGTLDPTHAVLRPASGSIPPAIQETRVRFLEGDDGELSVLEVETYDRSGLLFALSRALFEQRVQIVRSEVHTEGKQVRDRFSVLELDGAAIRPERRLMIQVAVLSAIDPTRGIS